MGLGKWFGKGPQGDWVDIGAPKKDGKVLKENIQNAYQEQKLTACQHHK